MASSYGYGPYSSGDGIGSQRQTPSLPPSASATGQNYRWWIPAAGIRRDVIQADIQRYLGPVALVRPGEGRDENEGQSGYWIAAYRTLTPAMIDDLRADSANFERSGDRGRYEDSMIHRTRQHWNPAGGTTLISEREPLRQPRGSANSLYSYNPTGLTYSGYSGGSEESAHSAYPAHSGSFGTAGLYNTNPGLPGYFLASDGKYYPESSRPTQGSGGVEDYQRNDPKMAPSQLNTTPIHLAAVSEQASETSAHRSQSTVADHLDSKADVNPALGVEQMVSLNALTDQKVGSKRDSTPKGSLFSDNLSEHSEATLLEGEEDLDHLDGLSPSAFNSALIAGMKHDMLALALRKAKTKIDSLIYQTPNSRGSSSKMGSIGNSTNSSEVSSNPTNGRSNRKRARGAFNSDRESAGHDEDEDGHSDEDNFPKPSKKAKLSSKRLTGLKLACHYYKHDPELYNSGACIGPGFQDIHRVKEHLFRKHKRPIHCPRCCNIFKDEDDLSIHAKAERCSANDIRIEGLTEKQFDALKSRKIQPGQTAEDRWKDIYRLLFANELVPSPYYEPTSETARAMLDHYRSLLEEHLPDRIAQAIELVIPNFTEIQSQVYSAVIQSVQDAHKELSTSNGHSSSASPLSADPFINGADINSDALLGHDPDLPELSEDIMGDSFFDLDDLYFNPDDLVELF